MDLPPVDPQWWRTLFDEVYLQTDARSVQDRDVTRREVDALVRALALQPGEAVLDLCGGHGRHALELTRRGYGPVTVLDYSKPLLCRGLAQAREEGLSVAFIRGDARRLPLARDSFRVVALLANSFGYGATNQDDLEVLKESRRLLRQGGRLCLETADPQFVRGHLPPQSWHETPEGLVVCRRRWVTQEFLICRELVLCRGRGLVRDATYRMRLYDPEALRSCLKEAGFSRVRVAAQPAASGPESERGSLSRRLAAVAAR
ncbi:MAG TPA: methyltransferase domain-containing protein [Desulfobaccales bacterium]